MDREQLVTTVTEMRSGAQDHLRTLHRKRWPNVSGALFDAILNALGEISVDEAYLALDRIQQESR